MGTTIFEDLYIIHALQYATNCLEQPSKRQPKYHKKVFLKNENKWIKKYKGKRNEKDTIWESFSEVSATLSFISYSEK